MLITYLTRGCDGSLRCATRLPTTAPHGPPPWNGHATKVSMMDVD
jgi:hypothetical protein